METNHSMADQKLGLHDLLREALQIPLKNTNFIFFASFASLPLFSFLIFFETLLQTTLLDFSEIISRIPDNITLSYYNPFHVDHVAKRMTIDCSYKLIHLTLLYLVPLHLFELGSAVATIDIASEIYIEEKPMTLREMLHKPFRKESLKRALYTSFCVMCLSICTLFGLVWLVMSYLFLFKTCSYFYHHYWFFVMISGTAFMVLIIKYLERSVVWNISVVISVLEERSGFRALGFSGYVNRGSERRGMILMLVFFAWGVGLRLFCFVFGCKERGFGVLVEVGLFCVGNLCKWLVCLVYFYDCKKRVLEKKADVVFDRMEEVEDGVVADAEAIYCRN